MIELLEGIEEGTKRMHDQGKANRLRPHLKRKEEKDGVTVKMGTKLSFSFSPTSEMVMVSFGSRSEIVGKEEFKETAPLTAEFIGLE